MTLHPALRRYSVTAIAATQTRLYADWCVISANKHDIHQYYIRNIMTAVLDSTISREII